MHSNYNMVGFIRFSIDLLHTQFYFLCSAMCYYHGSGKLLTNVYSNAKILELFNCFIIWVIYHYLANGHLALIPGKVMYYISELLLHQPEIFATDWHRLNLFWNLFPSLLFCMYIHVCMHACTCACVCVHVSLCGICGVPYALCNCVCSVYARMHGCTYVWVCMCVRSS